MRQQSIVVLLLTLSLALSVYSLVDRSRLREGIRNFQKRICNQTETVCVAGCDQTRDMASGAARIDSSLCVIQHIQAVLQCNLRYGARTAGAVACIREADAAFADCVRPTEAAKQQAIANHTTCVTRCQTDGVQCRGD